MRWLKSLFSGDIKINRKKAEVLTNLNNPNFINQNISNIFRDTSLSPNDVYSETIDFINNYELDLLTYTEIPRDIIHARMQVARDEIETILIKVYGESVTESIRDDVKKMNRQPKECFTLEC